MHRAQRTLTLAQPTCRALADAEDTDRDQNESAPVGMLGFFKRPHGCKCFLGLWRRTSLGLIYKRPNGPERHPTAEGPTNAKRSENPRADRG